MEYEYHKNIISAISTKISTGKTYNVKHKII